MKLLITAMLATTCAIATANAQSTCPAKVVRNSDGERIGVVESKVPRITLEQAARRILSGDHVIKFATVRGSCLRVYSRGGDGEINPALAGC